MKFFMAISFASPVHQAAMCEHPDFIRIDSADPMRITY